MPQKGQIQQHEWLNVNGVKHKCRHCKCLRLIRVRDIPESYWDNIKQEQVFEEPACITRKINAPASDKAD